jgi:polyisoprenoid-binding protein YceI
MQGDKTIRSGLELVEQLRIQNPISAILALHSLPTYCTRTRMSMANAIRNSTLVRWIIILVVVGGLIGAAAMAYLYFTGGSGEASAPISAPDIAADSTTSEGVVFNIVPEDSRVRFTLDELLMGNPNTVIGQTEEVAGQILVNFDNPAESQVGVIRINVRTLATDNDMRNRAIRSQILRSQESEFEFAEFAPTALSGMPEQVTIGEAFTFQITGNLTVRGTTNEVTFDATVTPESETRIVGSASTTVQRAMYDLQIPSVQGVADVSEDVLLEITFVATADAAE